MTNTNISAMAYLDLEIDGVIDTAGRRLIQMGLDPHNNARALVGMIVSRVPDGRYEGTVVYDPLGPASSRYAGEIYQADGVTVTITRKHVTSVSVRCANAGLGSPDVMTPPHPELFIERVHELRAAEKADDDDRVWQIIGDIRGTRDQENNS